jgi:Uma2 family endonuclease
MGAVWCDDMRRVLASTDVLPELKELLARRTAMGLDRRDEMWDGVLHLNRVAGTAHAHLLTELAILLDATATERGLHAIWAVGFFDPADPEGQWRVPDVLVAKPEQVTERGVEGSAELVVEVLWPDDESVAKLPFYARMGVKQVLLIDPFDLSFVLHRLGRTRYRVVDDNRLDALGVHLARELDEDGPVLVLSMPSGRAEIRPWVPDGE